MPWLTQLADVARRTGHPVTEVGGWERRGHGAQPAVRGIVCHHTAGASAGGDYPSLAVVRSGRPGLDGPLSHFGIGRSGRVYVIAAGRCWHNAPSTSTDHSNSNSIGIEAENDGRQPWPAAQLDAYRRLCAELCREFGLSADRVRAHREVNTAKPDPHGIDMSNFRAEVARLIKGDNDVATPKSMWDEVIPEGPDWPHAWKAGTLQRYTAANVAEMAGTLADLETKHDALAATLAEILALLKAPPPTP
jgi:hypothetical protein